RSFSALSSSLTETTRGQYCSTCSAISSTFDPAPKAATPNSPLKAVTTRRVLQPIEPVEPRIAICFINSSPLQGGAVLPVAPLSFERFYLSFHKMDVSPGHARHHHQHNRRGYQ